MNEPGAPWFVRSALRHFEFFSGCLAFIRTAHYWTMLHPEIETEDDMQQLLRGHEELARLLLEDPEADRCEMGERLFEELTSAARTARASGIGAGKASVGGEGSPEGPVHCRSRARTAQSAERRFARQPTQCASSSSRIRERLGWWSGSDRQTTAMARMLDDLLDASRIALGKVSVQIERLDSSRRAHGCPG